MKSFMGYFWNKLPRYFDDNDTYPDSEGRGLLQRYLSIFSGELDDGTVPLIDGIKYLMEPRNIRFLPIEDYTLMYTPLGSTLGDPPNIFLDARYTHWSYGHLLNAIHRIYQTKGSVVSFQYYFAILGFRCIITESIGVIEDKYDNGLKYDDGLKYDNNSYTDGVIDIDLYNIKPLFEPPSQNELDIIKESCKFLLPIDCTIGKFLFHYDNRFQFVKYDNEDGLGLQYVLYKSDPKAKFDGDYVFITN